MTGLPGRSPSPVSQGHLPLRLVLVRGVATTGAATGGVVGVTGLGIFLGDNDSSTDRLVEHVCHYADLVGSEHVGIGLDHVHVAFDLAEEVSGRPDYWPPGQQYDTPGITCAHPSQAHGICEQLLDRGFSDAEVTGILGGNFLRVAEQVWG